MVLPVGATGPVETAKSGGHHGSHNRSLHGFIRAIIACCCVSIMRESQSVKTGGVSIISATFSIAVMKLTRGRLHGRWWRPTSNLRHDSTSRIGQDRRPRQRERNLTVLRGRIVSTRRRRRAATAPLSSTKDPSSKRWLTPTTFLNYLLEPSMAVIIIH